LVLPGKQNGMPPDILQLLGFGIISFFKLLFTRKKIDVLHIGDMASWMLALAFRFRFSSARILVSAHGTDVAFQNRSGLPAYLYGIYLNLGVVLLSRDTLIIANSSATEVIVKNIGFESVKVVPLATDISVK